MLTRRRFLIGSMLTAMGGLLAACGGDDEASEPTATSGTTSGGATPTAATGSATATRPAPTGATPAASPQPSGSGSAGQVRQGGTLTVATIADPLTLDPHLAGNFEGRATSFAVHDNLFLIDENGRLAPNLVTEWSQPDDKSYLLKLRQGVKFHDDTPFNAEAVRYNLERVRNPDTKSLRAGEINALDTIEIVDEHTIKLNLKYPFSAFLFPLADAAGAIGSPAAMEQWGIQDYGFHPVGTGAFKFVEYQKDNRTVLERNSDYWLADRPALERLIIRPIPIDSTRLSELRSGGIQMAEALPFQDVQRLRDAKEIVVSEKNGARFEYFGFNTKGDNPASSKAFRQAFQYAIDREGLHQTVYSGTGSVGYDVILPGSPFFDPNFKPYAKDLNKAKQLIAESGVSSVTLDAPLQEDPVKQRAAQIFQATAEELGVKVEIQVVDRAAMNEARMSGAFDVDISGWWGYRPDPDQYMSILVEPTGSWAKYYGIENPQIKQLMEAQRAAQQESERRTIFRQISDIVADESILVCWHNGSDFKGLSPKVKGFTHYQTSIIRYRELWLEE